jgi:hypothetical protein
MLSPIRGGVVRTAAISNKGVALSLCRRDGMVAEALQVGSVHEGPAYVLDTPVQGRAGATDRPRADVGDLPSKQMTDVRVDLAFSSRRNWRPLPPAGALLWPSHAQPKSRNCFKRQGEAGQESYRGSFGAEAVCWGAGNAAGSIAAMGGGAADANAATGEIAATVATAGFFLIRFFGAGMLKGMSMFVLCWNAACALAVKSARRWQWRVIPCEQDREYVKPHRDICSRARLSSSPIGAPEAAFTGVGRNC